MSAPAGAGSKRTAPSDATRHPHWIHLFLKPDYPQRKLSDESGAPVGPETSASPGRIADAMLRSMLGNNGPAVTPISTPLSKLAGSGKKVADTTPERPASEAAQDNGIPLSIPLDAPAAILEPAQTDTLPAPGTNPAAVSPAATSPDALSAQVQAGVLNPPTDLAFEARLSPKVTDADAPAPLVSEVLPLKHLADHRDPEDSAAGDNPEAGGGSANSITAMAPGAAVSSRFSAPPAPTAPGPATDTPPVREPAHAEPALSTGSAHVRELTLRIAAPGGLPVDVQVNQHPGEIRVVVRTADDGMQLSLRQDLPQLVDALDRAGFHAETFTTHQAADSLLAPGVASSGETSAGNSSQDLSRDPSRDASRESGGKDSSFSSGAREQQQQQQQRQREHMHRSWLNQMEE
jgi:hypothetical protein